MDRQQFTPIDSVAAIWDILRLRKGALNSLHLIDDGECCPSSFKVDHLAQTCIALSALAAALFRSARLQNPIIPQVTVPNEHACVEFKSERLYALNGKAAPSSWGTIGGLHKTADGYVRMHKGFPNHRFHAQEILGLGENATREQVGKKMLEWNSVDLEAEAFRRGAAIAALRSFEQWDAHSQAKKIDDSPI
ncbi:hypothetical protein K504DRAFT_528899 [Pleomassaria siparia CBS 279.74]|uniref:CoA-transferase family III n=1 Tax=Pleomassaria siparia CBS 279.74 TaxID=1314801 RepID=A0A6G1KP68_9PLEO|nr:hypothetical protein K504DRAFT_528899 [Pleomassaria siparia CBS 279.74]